MTGIFGDQESKNLIQKRMKSPSHEEIILESNRTKGSLDISWWGKKLKDLGIRKERTLSKKG